MANQLPLIHAERTNNHITIDQTFGNPNVNGLQHKGALEIDGQHYFAKLDDLNPAINGKWEDKFDVQYSSVSEAIASLLVKHIQSDPHFESVEYEFATFDIKGNQKTGTLSKNYLRENEVEKVLAVGRTVDNHTLITTDEYAERIMDLPSDQDRLDQFIKYFTDQDVPYEHAKDFLVQQIAFDIMTGNGDRLGNPSNFIIAYNNETKTGRPINFDYGRTLPLMWTKTTEERYDLSWLEEDLDFYTKDLNSKNDSIINGLTPKETMWFLEMNGFKPFELDTKALKKDLEQLNQTIQTSNAPFKTFASVKIKAFEQALEQTFMKQFYVDKPKNPTIDFTKTNPNGPTIDFTKISSIGSEKTDPTLEGNVKTVTDSILMQQVDSNLNTAKPNKQGLELEL